LAHSNVEYLLLEKPIAHSPEVAERLHGDLIRSGKVFRIGYIFRFTTWGERILRAFGARGENRPISLRWTFSAHHFLRDLRTWKRFNAAGGGAVRFYGIQIISLLAEIGYRGVTVSRSFGASADEIEKWIATFSGPGLPECNVTVDSRCSDSQFRVEEISDSTKGPGIVFANLTDPFESEGEPSKSKGLDRRVSPLTRLCRSLWDVETNEYVWYGATIKLWRCVEEQTLFEMEREGDRESKIANIVGEGPGRKG
jgi:hypothetical protein